jgi:hypothetical protein
MSIYRESRKNVDLPRIVGECRSTANRGGMSIQRGSRGNVDPPRIVEECRFTAHRGRMSIHRESRKNVDLPRIARECRFTANRAAMSIYRDCVWRLIYRNRGGMGGEGGFIPLPRGSSCPPRTGLLYFMCAGGACSPGMKVHPVDHIVR